MAESPTKGRLQLIMVGGVFLGPFLLAYFLYHAGGDWLPATGTEHGQLLQPPRLLPDALLNPAGDDDSPRFQGKWSLIVVGEGRCSETCREVLYETRQIRRALGREAGRVQRVFCIENGEPDFAFLDAEHPGLVILAPESSASRSLLPMLGMRDPGDIFLADPFGNLIMRFPRGTGMKGIHKDLKHLLKASRTG